MLKYVFYKGLYSLSNVKSPAFLARDHDLSFQGQKFRY